MSGTKRWWYSPALGTFVRWHETMRRADMVGSTFTFDVDARRCSEMSVLELSFPEVVDDRAARTVASGVIVTTVAALVTRWPVLVVLLAGGFWLRVLYGPRYSPLALLVTRVLVPRYPGSPRIVPGPPKRFAQGIGAAWTTAAALLLLAGSGAGWVLVALLLVPAGLEAALGFCVGCQAFRLLIKAGVVPESVCERCVW